MTLGVPANTVGEDTPHLHTQSCTAAVVIWLLHKLLYLYAGERVRHGLQRIIDSFAFLRSLTQVKVIPGKQYAVEPLSYSSHIHGQLLQAPSGARTGLV